MEFFDWFTATVVALLIYRLALWRGEAPSPLIDHALLVSSIYNVERWREHMFERTGEAIFHGNIDSLSPIEQITGMSDQVEVTLMVGSEDEVAPPSFSEQYETAARKHGKRVRLVRIEGEDHEIFLKQAVFAELEPMLG